MSSMKLRPLPISIYYIFIFGVGLGFLLAFRTYLPYLYWGEGDNYIWTRYSLPSIINYSLWPFFVPFVYHFSYKWQIGRSHGLRANSMAVVSCLVISLTHEFLTNAVYFVPLELMDWYHIDDETMRYLKGAVPAAVINRIVEYWIIVFSLRAIDNYLNLKKSEVKMARIESQLTQAKLRALRMQLQPHFLFNTLNTISSLLDVNTAKARSVIAKFADILRNVLESDDKRFISLDEEIQNTQNYLVIEQTRFSDRLDVSYDIAREALDILVPSFILQPIVENAIKHGLSKSSESLHLSLKASIDGRFITLSVHDDGQGASGSDDLFGKGVGLSNARERLQNLFGSESYIKIDTSPGEGFHVSLTFPIMDGDVQ